MFKAWIPSCSWCIWSEAGEQAPPHQVHAAGNSSRDVAAVCHEQPRPVAPMKLVLYDNIPNSPRVDSRASLLPTLVTEGRNLASRASNRASLLLKSNRQSSPRKLRISAPSNFRHLTFEGEIEEEAPPRRRRSFRPLELSIYIPGNQLPALPVFDNFDIDDFSLETDCQDNYNSPTPPPKALCSSGYKDDYRRSVPSLLYPKVVARKPVGSQSGRHSLYIEIHDRRHTMPDPEKLFQNVESGTPSPPPRRSSETLDSPPDLSLDSLVNLKTVEIESPSSCLSTPSRDSTTHTPHQRHHHTRSRPITEWFATKSYHHRANSSPRFGEAHSRARTLSGSTMVSFANGSTGGHASRNPSLSSSMMMTTSAQSPLSFHALTEKDYELCDSTANYRFHTQEPCPTVYELNRPISSIEESYHCRPLSTNDIGMVF